MAVSTQTKPNLIKRKMFRLFHSKLLLSAQNTTSYVNRGEEKLSRATKLKKASTVNKGLAAANLCSCGGGAARSAGPAKLQVTAVTTVMRFRCPSFRPGKTAPLGVIETGSLLGTLWNTVCFSRPKRESQATFVP
ncbi:hypothetical protein AMECASPLE_018141 [Ameca splendens]|uniref:Uncharacterized protein n=1 Tax=Ameca splendens TaxID=208324 RepID=A0ABV0Z1F7_9TELE